MINISIINHFGKNPKNGGKPPKDNKGINNIIFKNLLELNNLKVWLILKILKLLNIKTILIFKNI